MEKAYKIVGISRNHPGTLPKGFRVVEKEVGEVHQVQPLRGEGRVNFVETKQGDIVVYREGATNSNVQIKHEDLPSLIQFMNRIWVEHSEPVSKCPGTPHRGHSASDWSCWMDRQ